GHVDHGKSTLIGRLLADTHSLPIGKLDQVKAICQANAKPFEYAFLLDALKDERSQGITIDTARIFFKTQKRHYIILDAPGHIEFLKNMITGAARAEAAILVIDAKEGVQENSRRHGYMMAMLGIKQLVVVINKMDLVGYDEAIFHKVREEYLSFLSEIDLEPLSVIPVSAREGKNLVQKASEMAWYSGNSILEQIDLFQSRPKTENIPFRFPVQDIYKFTKEKDDRRIIAGTLDTGMVKVGDTVQFLPSEKTSTIKTIEGFNTPETKQSRAGQATGFTLTEQIYIKPGELMVPSSDSAIQVGSTFKANVFWLGIRPLVMGKKYKLKSGASRQVLYLKHIEKVLDASDLSTNTTKDQVNRHDVATVVFQTVKPFAFDTEGQFENTSRFVIIDDYEIMGGGIILENLTNSNTHTDDTIQKREFEWIRSRISSDARAQKFQQKPMVIIFTGPKEIDRVEMALKLEEDLFRMGKGVYFLGISNLLSGLDSDIHGRGVEGRDEHI
ncbi:MAG: adenylyl-sulfate kinase, partial [Candidatus Margulisbacteria bacterium]|nr:adenylyl-sulfate kinase [Candidatus Margulisiibacteriota bacterium]